MSLNPWVLGSSGFGNILMLIFAGPSTFLSKTMIPVGLVCLSSPLGVASVFPVFSEWLVLQVNVSIFLFPYLFIAHVLSPLNNKFNSIQFNTDA